MNRGLKASVAGKKTAPLKRPQRLGEEVYKAIYDQLMSHKIAPGGRIAVDGLARELGVSQTPVREALSRLEAQGLIVKTHLVGYSAANQLDERRLGQLYEIRMLLEPFAAARAAANATDETLESFDQLARHMEERDQPGSRIAYGEFARYDSEFHELVAAASGNELIQDTLSRLHVHVHLFRLFYHTRATTGALREHAEIIEAIRNRDPAAAEAAMRSHIESSKGRFMGYFES